MSGSILGRPLRLGRPQEYARVHRYRIVVLAFLIGASAANVVVAKQFDDVLTNAVATIPKANTIYVATPLGTFGVGEAYARARYAAIICELAILAVSASAWFLISKRLRRSGN